MNDKLNDIEEEILNILHSKNILLQDIGALEDWILQPKRLSGVKMVHEDEQKTKEQLAAINAYEVELWREIYARLEDPQYKAQIQEKLKGYSGENMLDKIHQDA